MECTSQRLPSYSFVVLYLSGRFARDRSSGFGSNYLPPKNALSSGKVIDEDIPTQGKGEMPPSQSLVTKICCCSKGGTNYEDGPGDGITRKKVPPPDFYLGETPGTQIWARLRLAGLETERVFDLDTRKVMIKIRCPTDRIMDVAEVLMLRLKTVEGKLPILELVRVCFVLLRLILKYLYFTRRICTIQGEHPGSISKD